MTGCNGIFEVTYKKEKLFLANSNTDKNGFVTNPPGAYENESVNDKFRRIILEGGFYTKIDYPYSHTKPNFSTL